MVEKTGLISALFASKTKCDTATVHNLTGIFKVLLTTQS